MTWAILHLRAFWGLFCPDFYSDIEDFNQILCRYLPKKLAAKISESKLSLCEGFATTRTPCIYPPKIQKVIEIPDVVRIPERAEIVEVDELAQVLKVVKEGVEVPPEKPSCLNCDAEMMHDHQCEAIESDSSWEDVENEKDLYPTLDVESENWDEKFTISIRRFHGILPN